MTHDLQDHRYETLHECPECGKRSLARINESRFHCLSCRFDRDVDQIETPSKPNNGGKAITGLMLLLLVGMTVFSGVTPSVKNRDVVPGVMRPLG